MPLRKDIQKVLVIGSGPIVIGQAAEFDYAGTQACLALREENIEVVLVNSNPATIMTDDTIADRVYIEPLTTTCIEKIMAKERPDGLIGTLGGQTGLNLTVELKQEGILEKYGVQLLGSSVDAIQKGEDREKFRQLMMDINEPIPQSEIITSVEAGFAFVQTIGYPVIIRPAYTLGGSGGGFAYNDEQLQALLEKGLYLSPIHQVLVEKSIKGWKEIEYEVMRDANDTCIIVCNMENMDPVGVHTGDSIVVCPSQTLTDVQYQMLRNSSLKVIRALGVIGGCNIQFALDPQSEQYFIIEVNPRVSRSSALASKATGYPIARMAAKCAIGYHLDELLNPVTGHTYASFEPAIDYIVVKLPRFPFDKFTEADRTLGTQMKATGEVMAIDRSFEGALNKGLRSLEMKVSGLKLPRLTNVDDAWLVNEMELATDIRLFCLAEAFRRGMSLEQIREYTLIDRWFLSKIERQIAFEGQLLQFSWEQLPIDLLRQAKKFNIGDAYLAQLFGIKEREVRQYLKGLGLKPGYKSVDTCAAEFDAQTPYYYSTWLGQDEVQVDEDRQKVLVVGSGPIRIGQGIEFDYCSVHAALALKEKGYQSIVVNNNPETVSTDYSIADKLYFEPLAVEDLLSIIEKEQVQGVLIQFGGQTAINVAQGLADAGVRILGTSIRDIDTLEDRRGFYALLNKLDIPHIAGQTVNKAEELLLEAKNVGFPVIVRPSYVIGGQSMFIFYDPDELEYYVQQLLIENDQSLWPLLVDSYIPGMECEVDVLSDGENIIIPGIFEHIERAGVHSGDSITVFPPISIGKETQRILVDYASRIAREAKIIGMMNIQFVISEDKVFVIEVNPRASRTVPILSKVTGIPMVNWATRLQLGERIEDLSAAAGLLPEPDFYSVKVPVFSNTKLNDVDDALGPEMKSTGEILGLGRTISEALLKGLFLGQGELMYGTTDTTVDRKDDIGKTNEDQVNIVDQKGEDQMNAVGQSDIGDVFCSIAEREKSACLPQIQELSERGFRLLATPGTAEFLSKHGIEAVSVSKDRAQLEQIFQKGSIQMVINMANQGRVKEHFGFGLRVLARKYNVMCFTCMDTLKAALSLPKSLQWDNATIKEYQSIMIERV